MQSRYYNPEWGRFLNADGYISTGTGMIGYNMYAYCNNNPVMYVDPTGEFWLAALIFTAVVTLCTIGLTGCSSVSREEQAELDRKMLDPAAKDTSEEALEEAFDRVYKAAKNDNFKYEYGIFVYKSGDYYYTSGAYTCGKIFSKNYMGDMAREAIAVDESIITHKQYEIIGFIHTHPWHNNNIIFNEIELKNKREYNHYVIDVCGCRYVATPEMKRVDQPYRIN